MNLKDIAKGTRKVLPLKKCGVVIVAAGSASRMGGIDKVMATLGGEPMIVKTVRAFQNCGAIQEPYSSCRACSRVSLRISLEGSGWPAARGRPVRSVVVSWRMTKTPSAVHLGSSSMMS